MFKVKSILIVTVVLLFLSACGEESEATKTPTPRPATATVSPTPQPTATETPQPTASPTPTLTPTPLNPQAILDAAFAAIESAKSHRETVTLVEEITSDLTNFTFEMSYEGVIEPPDRINAVTTMNFDGETVTMEQITIGLKCCEFKFDKISK